MTLRIERYKNTRHWALYDGHELVVVTVYRRGAQEVQRRLAAQPRAVAAGPGGAGPRAAERRGGSGGRLTPPAQPASLGRATEHATGPGWPPVSRYRGLGVAPSANKARWRRARRPACGRRGSGARTPGAPRRHLMSSGAGLGTDCGTEPTVV